MNRVVWFTGLSGAGKSTIAELLKTELTALGEKVRILDGDVVRDSLHKHLGFTREDIKENNRLIAELARKYAKEDEIILVPIISPFTESRTLARRIIGEGFVELYIKSSEATRITRDPKGLYKKAKEGSIKNLIGYGGVEYEIPAQPDITINTDSEPLKQSVERVLHFLTRNEAERHLFFVYELEHLVLLEERIAAGEKFEIVGLDYEVELEMKKRGIPFTPLRDISVAPEGNREVIEFTRRSALSWYSSSEMDFLQYNGIFLGEQYEGVVLYYLQTLIYYIDVLKQVLAHFPDTIQISIPESFRYVSNAADPVVIFKECLPTDVVQLLAKNLGIRCEVIPPPLSKQARDNWLNLKMRLEQGMFRIIVWLSNIGVTLLRKSRPIRLFVTDPWSRLEPFIKDMPDVELVMARRHEMRVMGIKNIWKTHARFHHRLDFIDRIVRVQVQKRAQEIVHQWDTLGETPEISKEFVYKDISFWPVAKKVLDTIVREHTEDTIATIENTKRILARYQINCVLVRVSTKGYDNVISRVAEHMDIPSIELQHAFSPVEPSHPYARLPARYLASYGAFVKRVYERFGVSAERIALVGSPRFDVYAAPVEEKREALRQKLRLDKKYVNVLVAIPALYLALELYTFTSYAVQDSLEDFSLLQKNNPNLRFLLRPKPGLLRKSFYNREETLGLFSSETRMVQFDDLPTLLEISDFVISGNSALVLEAMLAHKPVLMYLPRRGDGDFQEFEDAGAVLVARSIEELFQHTVFLTHQKNRDELVNRADIFLRDNFMLDGKSSERVATLIREVRKR